VLLPMNAAQTKFLISLALVLALWRIFEIPGVSTAFWALITIGAIPGSNTVLGSDMMLRILCILFAVCFFLIFRKEFFASLPYRRQKQTVTADVSDAHSAEIPAIVPVVRPNPLEQTVVILNKQKDRSALASARPAFVILGYVAVGLVRIVAALEAYAERFVRAAAAGISQASRWIWRHLKRLGQNAYRLIFVIVRTIGRALVLAWRISEPHIRAFDRWLEAQLRANRRTAGVLRVSGGVGKATMDAYRKAQDTTRKLIADK
jgi:hypothetical protein